MSGIKNIDTVLRPTTLAQLHGDEVEESIKKAAEMNQITHSFLLTGPSGNGKTTTARTIASFLFTGNTEQEYDLEQSQCYIEINGSTDNGIDDMRQILMSVQEVPLTEDKIVLVIDEAHGLSKQAQSSILKCLEEPPDHLYIMLCTNLPNKLEASLKNRCKLINFNVPTEEVLKRYARQFVLPKILEQLDSHTRNLCKPNIESLNDVTLSKIISGIDFSYRSMIIAVHDYIISGIIQSQSGVEDESVKDVAYMLIDPKENWRPMISNQLKIIKDFDAFRRSVVNYMSVVYLNSLTSISIRDAKDTKYLYAINKLKGELSYTAQKGDLLERMVDIVLTNAGKMEMDSFKIIK